MTTSQQAAYSRPRAVAARLVGSSAAENLLQREVLLTADATALAQPAGRSCFLACISLLTRFCADLVVRVPEPARALEQEARALVARIGYAGRVRFCETENQMERYGAILNVGFTRRSDLPWTAISTDGWAVQICSEQGPDVLNFSEFNPAATLAAACLGAAEVFKRLLGVLAEVAPMLRNEVFSLLTYTADSDPGPSIRGPIRLNCLLAGFGAIGNGIRHALIELPAEGQIVIVDKQHAGEENWGTYIDLGPIGFGQPKVSLASAGWNSAVTAVPLKLDVLQLAERLGGDLPFPDVVLGALDNVEARHAIQRLWPDIAIDGATGDVTCQVSRHPWGGDTACLECLFRTRDGEDSAVVASRVTGLSVASARRQEEVVTQQDIDEAPAERKAWLAARKGHQKCSVVREAMMEKLTGGKVVFSPSAPFVACMSAAMVVGEFIKYRTGIASKLDPRFQFDVLVGPRAGVMLDQARRENCFCVTRRKAIERFRGQRENVGKT